MISNQLKISKMNENEKEAMNGASDWISEVMAAIKVFEEEMVVNKERKRGLIVVATEMKDDGNIYSTGVCVGGMKCNVHGLVGFLEKNKSVAMFADLIKVQGRDVEEIIKVAATAKA